MTRYRLLPDAEDRIGEIYAYTQERWGREQADQYYEALFDQIEAIAARSVPWRRIPTEFEVDGYYCRYARHFIYWRVLEADVVGIVTILHQQMRQATRVRVAFDD